MVGVEVLHVLLEDGLWRGGGVWLCDYFHAGGAWTHVALLFLGVVDFTIGVLCDVGAC